ncbi:MAG TPA: malto-oligosyltrehalose synthase [Pirellulales bacterium]
MASCNPQTNLDAQIPAATYRLQFSGHVNFREARELVGYFDELGIGAVYASPLFKARRDSSHGYDVVDHNTIHPEFGTEDEFRLFAEGLQAAGMGLLLDVVPNHMAIDDNTNLWWQDVLANGRGSPYAKFFDIDWDPPQEELKDKILVPVLGEQYGKVLENEELKLVYAGQRFWVDYYARRFPVTAGTWPRILQLALVEYLGHLASHDPARMELESIVTELERLPRRSERDPEKLRERQRESEVARRRLAALMLESEAVRTAIDATIRQINGHRGDARSFDRLEALLAEQTYRLSFWRVASDEINYRRFFDINELAAVHVEDPEVFAQVHAMMFRFLGRGWVTGLRVDHVDGLLDPQQYLASLQAGFRAASTEHGRQVPDGPKPLYIVVEKILGADEKLRATWATHGTTGYDFLNLACGLFVDRYSAKRIKDIYTQFTDVQPRFNDIFYESKKTILGISMSSELHMLSRRLNRISEQHRWSRDFTAASLRRALAEVIACFPVYRTYIQPGDKLVCDQDRQLVVAAVRMAKRRNPAINKSVFDFIASILLLEDPDGLSEAQRQERREFVLRCQQMTGPVTAKGLEDTAFYRAYPLASLNEVGGDPGHFGTPPDEFHRRLAEQAAAWPATMLASATHDTKRGEDVRARINVLSEVPDAWERALARWRTLNRGFKSQVEGEEAPNANEEFLFYQTALGCWPLGSTDDAQHGELIDRLVAYMHKATREAKLNTSWINPDEDYGQAIENFVRGALDRQRNGAFVNELSEFVAPLARAGACNSLAQTLLKICAPGVPDFYQGTELWDLNLVDPDNRRPVDFALRRQFLQSLRAAAQRDRKTLLAELTRNWQDGRIKLYMTQAALHFRRAHAGFLLTGDYLPLSAVGERKDQLFGFGRRQGERWMLAIVPRCVAACVADDRLGFQPGIWQGSGVPLPYDAPSRWQNLFSGEALVAGAASGEPPTLAGEDLFRDFPVAMLTSA